LVARSWLDRLSGEAGLSARRRLPAVLAWTVRISSVANGGSCCIFELFVLVLRTIRLVLADRPPEASQCLSPLLLVLCFRFGLSLDLFLELVGPL
jgi:hypothetical protein